MNIKKISELDEQINSLLDKIENVSAEELESDELVSSLLEYVKDRQFLVGELLSNENDQVELTLAYELSHLFSARATKLLRHRQDLINLSKSNKRKIDAYKNISSDR
ncbi:hypothetical protein H5181_19030 [Shewanella sp. SG44-2]|uniref:hypothetical protein n=1 Tax=Shewanella sp. SG44-2 TaxID=2760962 RepID=UPI001602C4A3|nr:hypothetical protein [Shewanella sp. SG44-2]MBB1428531.1 hypothetical protein [Shewanella sp. SG44-2]